MLHRGEVLVICSELHVRSTKDLVSDGAPPDLGTWCLPPSLWRWERKGVGCAPKIFKCIFSFKVFCVNFLGGMF
jgi:hypothetical protein